jgi:actin-related protein
MPGLHEMVYQSIMKCDLDMRRDLYSNVVLSGGSSMFPGTTERVMKELVGLVPSHAKVNVVGPADREYLTWVGGSILSSMATFRSMWISKNDYMENGPTIVHRKCF